MKFPTIIIILLLAVSMVAAQETESGGRLVNVHTVVYDDPDTAPAAFVFLPKLTEYDVRVKWTADRIDYIPSGLGKRCQVGDYVTLLSCESASGTGCKRAQSVDWKIESTLDVLQIQPLMSNPWWSSFKTGRYIGYDCRVPKSTGGNTGTTNNPPATTDPKNFGRVTSVTGPSSAATGETVTIKAKYKALVNGNFLFECTFDQTRRTPLSVITSSSSTCDGSVFTAGRKVTGVAGTEYEFKYTVRAPTSEGNYPIICSAWTDCYDKGGQFIHGFEKSAIPVKNKVSCNLAKGVQEIFINSGLPLSDWTTDLVNFHAPGCDLSGVKGYCGSIDTDGDEVPDNCDYCPQGAGSITGPVVGCHPCFGKSVVDTCWDTYKDEFGIPEEVQNRRNPKVGTGNQCDGDELQVCVKRQDGSLEECQKEQDCIDCQITSKGDVTCTQVEEHVPDSAKVINTYQACGLDNNVHTYQELSDGQKRDILLYKECNYGCIDGGCTPAPSSNTVNGGQVRTAENDGVTTTKTTGTTCSSDDNCPPSYKCDSQTNQCTPYYGPLGGCNADTDCDTGYECILGNCIESAIVECKYDGECEETEYCYGGFCVAESTTEEELAELLNSCTTDKIQVCEDGTTVITAICVDNQYNKLGNFCPETGGGGSGSGGIIEPGTSTGSTQITIPGTGKSVSTLTLIILLALAGIAGYMFLPRKGKKRKKR